MKIDTFGMSLKRQFLCDLSKRKDKYLFVEHSSKPQPFICPVFKLNQFKLGLWH